MLFYEHFLFNVRPQTWSKLVNFTFFHVSGKFCGTGKLPGTLVSSDSRMWIQYKASRGTTHKGFVANYEGRKITFLCRNTFDRKLQYVCNYPIGCFFHITVHCNKKSEISDSFIILITIRTLLKCIRKLCSEYVPIPFCSINSSQGKHPVGELFL